MVKKSVILVGATGLVGSLVLQGLLQDDRFSAVTIVTRRPIDQTHAKLKSIVCDFDALDSIEGSLKADCFICCLGTTIKKAGSQGAFARIDHDYPVQFAKIGRENGAKQFILLTAMGADPSSRIFYNKVKGRVEESIETLGFGTFDIIRPSVLLGDRDEFRFGEEFFKFSMPLLKLVLRGSLKRYLPVPADRVAESIVKLATLGRPGKFIHENDKLLSRNIG